MLILICLTIKNLIIFITTIFLQFIALLTYKVLLVREAEVKRGSLVFTQVFNYFLKDVLVTGISYNFTTVLVIVIRYNLAPNI